jgi:F-type H+-transporting ATPase subunit gamma
MAKARAVLKRLKAVKNIRKITRTMELIATARFKKAMDRATEAAAYTRKIAELASDLSASATGFSHPLLEAHESLKTGVLLVLTSNRGLCGGYNASVLKLFQQRLRDANSKGQHLSLEVSGKRGLNFCRFSRIILDQQYTQFEDKPGFDEVNEIASRYIDLYVQRKIDFVDVVYVRFESASRQRATLETLLPLSTVAGDSGKASKAASQVAYEFLPSAREILEELLPAAFKARLFKCFLDAAVSEQIFRRVAMKSATENAGEMIGDLSRIYNRARQSQITSELSEIIGGAEALA